MTLSLWLDTPSVSRPRLDGRKEADAIVLGAGMTGIGLAYFLSELRVRTLVLEAESVACGATGRNMGLLISGLGEHYARSVAFWGRSEAAAITSLHLDNQDLVGELVRHHGIECGYRRSGCYAVGADIQEEEELRQSCLLMQEDGFPCSFLDARNMNLALGGRGFFGGMHCPRDGVVDPVRLVRGLACAAERGGAVILERSSVQSISRDGLRWVVQTTDGSASAPLLFLACNAWLPFFRGGIPLRPVRGQCCAIHAPAAAIPDMACIGNYGAEYWRRSGDYYLFGGFGRLGGMEEGCWLDEVAAGIQHAIEEFARSHFPDLESAPVTHRWSGIMAFTPDGLPLVGPLPGESGLYFAGGYTGHGFGHAFATARRLAALAVEGRDEIPALCRIDRPMRVSPALEEI
ncbi:MAG: FAD-dependent oxidoreductase [Acidobacteriota bacterium]